jgi:hypothetical protein
MSPTRGDRTTIGTFEVRCASRSTSESRAWPEEPTPRGYKKTSCRLWQGTHLNVNGSAGPKTSHQTWPARSGARKHRSRRERADRSGTCPTSAAGELCDGRNASVTISICADVSQALQYCSRIEMRDDAHLGETLRGDICRPLRGLRREPPAPGRVILSAERRGRARASDETAAILFRVAWLACLPLLVLRSSFRNVDSAARCVQRGGR